MRARQLKVRTTSPQSSFRPFRATTGEQLALDKPFYSSVPGLATSQGCPRIGHAAPRYSAILVRGLGRHAKSPQYPYGILSAWRFPVDASMVTTRGSPCSPSAK
jgi:hypothetical protein